MKWEDYVPLAIRTESRPFAEWQNPATANFHRMIRLNHVALGLQTEFAELLSAGVTDKLTIHEHRNEELGDLSWYTAIGCDELKPQLWADSHPTPDDGLPVLEHRLLIAIGDFADCVKRGLYYGKFNEAKAAMTLATIHARIKALNWTGFDTVLYQNIAKLKKRFPDKFDAEKAEVRDLTAEATTLATIREATPAEQFEFELVLECRVCWEAAEPPKSHISIGNQAFNNVATRWKNAKRQIPSSLIITMSGLGRAHQIVGAMLNLENLKKELKGETTLDFDTALAKEVDRYSLELMRDDVSFTTNDIGHDALNMLFKKWKDASKAIPPPEEFMNWKTRAQTLARTWHDAHFGVEKK